MQASFAQTLRRFRSGDLTADAFLREVDDILANGRASATWMLATLVEEDQEEALPAEVHRALKEKIEAAAQAEAAAKGPNGNIQDTDGTEDPANTPTMLAPLHAVVDNAPPTGPTDTNDTPRPSQDSDRIKGTGDVLNNRFELEECVGAGGMGRVYKALDRRKLEASDRDPHVAVKVLNLEFRTHPDSLIALQREAKKCQNLAHPNIVRVYDFDRDGATVYMTMEHLSGESLARKTGAPGFKGMPANEALRIVNLMGRALAFAHEYGFVHSDFKPANVFITDSGAVKVIDFGIARAFQRAEDVQAEATLFDPGALGALTPTYASPEMLERKAPDPRDDLYSLACTTYEMLTGRHPFGRIPATAARNEGLQVKRHEALTRSQWQALRRALAFEREKRTPTVKQFLKEINVQRSLAERVALGAIAVGSVLLVGGGAAYYLSDSRHAAPPASNQATARHPIPETTQQAVEAVPEPPAKEEMKADPPKRVAAIAAPSPRPTATPEISLDSVLPLIQRISCSLIQASVDDGVVSLQGYAKEGDIARLKGDLTALAGVSSLALEITPISDEKCDIIEVMSPYWLANQQRKLGTSIQPKNETGRFVEGDSLILDIKTPAYDSYVNVDYYSLDGGVVHMIPSPRFRSNQAPANYAATIGDLGEWSVVGPFGTEMIVLLATPEPLFEKQRREYESKSAYLVELKTRLTQLARRVGEDRVTADFVLITTRKGS